MKLPFSIGNALLVCGMLSTICLSVARGQTTWPEHRGPGRDYHLTTPSAYPTTWSVASDKNIRWRLLAPETGHSGIAVWENRLFLTCFRKLTQADISPKGTWVSESRGYCIDADTGTILWSCDLPGSRPNQVNGTFTDATTPTPVTDGQHVWFVNAGGFVACHTFDGERIWHREFDVRTKHSAKQFQPFVHDGKLYYAMLREKDDPKRRPQTTRDWDKDSRDGWPWMFVRSFDALTGEPAGAIPGGISVHSRGALGSLDGKRVLLHARGGYHHPPEKPYGISLSSLDTGYETLWQRPDLYFEGTHFVDAKHAYCFDRNDFYILDLDSGDTLKKIRLRDAGVVRMYDSHSGKYRPPVAVAGLKWKRILTHRTSIGVGRYHFFMGGEPGILGRIDLETEDVSYLQVPIQVEFDQNEAPVAAQRDASSSEINGDLVAFRTESVINGWLSKGRYSWTEFQAGGETGSGFAVEGDRRHLNHGFGHITAATPIVVNNHIYFTTILGTVYVVDATAESFDENAIVSVNDLGRNGETWTLSPFSAANGRLFQRTSREIICIGE